MCSQEFGRSELETGTSLPRPETRPIKRQMSQICWLACMPQSPGGECLAWIARHGLQRVDVAAQHPERVEVLGNYLKTARSDSSDWPVKAQKGR